MSSSPAPCCSIVDFGAVGDDRTLNTRAIQAALDRVAELGGGVVLVPPGRFRTGMIRIRSNTVLELSPGSAIVGSPEMRDYEPVGTWVGGDRTPYHLLLIEDAHNVTLRGSGTIDGSGEAFWLPPNPPSPWYRHQNPNRPSPMIECVRCTNLRIEDVSIVNSPGWTVHLHDCDRVIVRGVVMRNHLFGPNTDGFDIKDCRDVLISDCSMEVGDDAIVLQSGKGGRGCERVAVTNCSLRSHCAALKCGQGDSFNRIRQVAFSNCVVHGSNRAFGLYCVNGATYEDIVVSNIVADTDTGFHLNRPIHIDLRRRDDNAPLGQIRNVLINNFVARSEGRILLTAEDGAVLENVQLRNIHLTYPAIDDPEAWAPQSKSNQFSNRSPRARAARAAVVAENMRGFVLRDLTITWPNNPQNLPMHVLWARNLEGGLIDVPLARPSRTDVEPFCLENCTASVLR